MACSSQPGQERRQPVDGLRRPAWPVVWSARPARPGPRPSCSGRRWRPLERPFHRTC